MTSDSHISLPEPVRRALENDFFIRFTATGRRSGRPRTSEVTFVWDGGRRITVSGYPGKRDWVANLLAHPSVTLHTVERGVFYDIPATARVLRDRDERTEPLLQFIEHWADRPEGRQPLMLFVVRLIRFNRRLHLPWWGPFYCIRKILDRMPCVEFTFTGEPTPRTTPPPPAARVQ